MIAESPKKDAASELRRQAERRISRNKQKSNQHTCALTQKTSHELAVYQVELEMQNEELRRTQAELERARDQYTELYDFAPVSYLTLDRQGTIRMANLAVTNLFNLERSGLIGQRLSRFVAPGDQATFRDFLQKVFNSQERQSCELWLAHEDQGKRYVQIEGSSDSATELCRVVIIDISIRRKFEENLIQHADLVDRVNDLEAFNYTVSHDLRTPLTVISGYAELLHTLCQGKIDEECQGFLQEINESALHMGKLIQTLLRFSQLSHAQVQRKSVDLSKAAHRVATELRLADTERQVDLRITKDIRTNCDPGLLDIILENLIGNAWKFTAEQQPAIIEIGMKGMDGKQVFFVKDNGPGFDAAQTDTLFLPFQRLCEISSEGYGIGLATVARIVQCHGGRIWAESLPGHGATFFFFLES